MSAHDDAMMRELLWVAFGGAFGAVTRVLVGTAVTERLGVLLPYGTFVINATGCLLIGVIMGGIQTQVLPAGLRPALVVGFLGGYTTFSAFGFETLVLLEEGHLLLAVVYVLASVLVGLGAVALGLWMGRALG
ncbi:MAG TPA: fluoride efflux transporter CrcB [Candidatus Binatia bacterium]|nr:fluoride efflux transporter CrcB [Candidatus Binatia bacterium]